MAVYSQEQIDYCHDLYVALDEYGDRICTWGYIVDKMSEQIKKVTKPGQKVTKFSNKTLKQWIDRYQWDDEIQQKKQAIIEAAQNANGKEATADFNRMLSDKTKMQKRIEETGKVDAALLGLISQHIYFTDLRNTRRPDTRYQFNEEQIERLAFRPSELVSCFKATRQSIQEYDKMSMESDDSKSQDDLIRQTDDYKEALKWAMNQLERNMSN